jgi:hypothetical protein
MRHQLSQQLEATKQTIENNELLHQQQLQGLREKFDAARLRLEKEADDRIAQSRQVCTIFIHTCAQTIYFTTIYFSVIQGGSGKRVRS